MCFNHEPAPSVLLKEILRRSGSRLSIPSSSSNPKDAIFDILMGEFYADPPGGSKNLLPKHPHLLPIEDIGAEKGAVENAQSAIVDPATEKQGGGFTSRRKDECGKG